MHHVMISIAEVCRKLWYQFSKYAKSDEISCQHMNIKKKYWYRLSKYAENVDIYIVQVACNDEY